MKKLIAAAGIGAALTVCSLVGAGAASADSGQDNYRYLQGLSNNGIYVSNTAVALSHGHTVCSILRNGGDGYTAQTWLVNANPGLGWNGAYNQVGLAAEYFCPSLNYLVYAPASY